MSTGEEFSMAVDKGGKTGRRPGATSTREGILAAARDHFTEHGYKGATLRAIAGSAEVDPALIRHFFGDKEGLFAAAMELPPDVTQLLLTVFDAPESEWGARLSRSYLGLWEAPATGCPLQVMAASAFANKQALDQLRDFISTTVLEAVRVKLGRDQADLRFALAMNHLVGTALGRHLLQVAPLTEPDLDTLCRLIAPTIQRYLTDPLPV